MSKSYEDQVREQIEQYRHTVDIHALPDIFHLWSHERNLPGLQQVFGVETHTDFYVEAFLKGANGAKGVPNFLSLGCGDGTVEIGIAKALLARGLTAFNFVCYDLSDLLLDRFRAALPPELADKFVLVAQDLNTYNFDAKFDTVMANHSLHHMVDLEGIFATAYAQLADHGVFVTNDMIGRNGHMRWPEAKFFVDFFWPFLTQRQRLNLPLSRSEAEFQNHDCSTEGFEGVRAQDIMQCLFDAGFHPWKFYGFGAIADVFVDRSFGHGFDRENPDDAFLIRRIGLINDLLLDAGVVKPTIIFAYFVKQPIEEISYRGRTARASVRPPETPPAWLAAILAEYAQTPDDPTFAFRDQTRALEEARTATLDAQALADTRAERVRALEASTSWRITAPLRALAGLLKR